ncbi:MAG: hypothetical protein IJY62_03015 [Clostridia bacterium]|nr:hypothetical protein [Clostridia bacterium]
MPTLYSIMAMPAFIMNNLKYFVIGAASLIALIVFIIGCARGCSRMGWGALVWGVASTLFLLVEIKFHDKNPVLKMGALSNLAPEIKNFVGALSVAIAAILVSCIVFGFFKVLARPRKKEDPSYYYRQTTYVEPADNDDGDDDYREEELTEYVPDPTYGKKKPRKIGGFNRFVGGLFAVIQTAVMLAAIASVALVVISATPFAGKLAAVYSSENTVVSKLWGYVYSYTFDLLLIALIAAIAVGGFKAGFLRGFSGILKFVGTLAAFAFLVVPFISPLTAMKPFGFVGSLSAFYGRLIGKIKAVGKFAPVLGKAACALTLSIVCGILVTVLCWLLRLIARSARRRSATFRFIDGTLSFFVMLAFAVAVCAILMILLYLPEYFNKGFKISEMFGPDSALAKGFYDFTIKYVKPRFDWIRALGK